MLLTSISISYIFILRYQTLRKETGCDQRRIKRIPLFNSSLHCPEPISPLLLMLIKILSDMD